MRRRFGKSLDSEELATFGRLKLGGWGRTLRRPLGVALTTLLLLGCGRTNLKADLDRSNRGEDDLVALLPRGLELVLDVDVADLRRLESSERLLALLPATALESSSALFEQPLRSLDGLAVGVAGLGGSEPTTIVLARGRFAADRLNRELRRRGATSEVEYHGLPLQEPLPPPGPSSTLPADAVASALLTPRALVLGNRQTVRQVIDIFRSDDDGARGQPELMAALGRAPRAKEGRPALMLAVLLTAGLRDKLRQAGLPELGADAEFLAASLAVGDGLDLGIVVGYREQSGAEAAAKQLLLKTQDLRQRPALGFLGLDRFIQPLVVVATPAAPKKGRPQPELHLAYRLPGDELLALLDRLATLKKLEQQRGPTPPQ